MPQRELLDQPSHMEAGVVVVEVSVSGVEGLVGGGVS